MASAAGGGARPCLDIGASLSEIDAARVERVFAKLERSGFRDHAVVGGLALEAALWTRDAPRRPLNDIDMVAPHFEALPAGLGDHFLVCHVHRNRPRGKMMAQFVCPEDAVRIDVFGACGAVLSRASPGTIGGRRVRVAALDDMASRIASELVSLVRGDKVHAKVLRDHRRLAPAVDPVAVEVAWTEQRRAIDPQSYAEACRAIEAASVDAGHLLTEPVYTAGGSDCPYCRRVEPFTLADRDRVEALLGYS